MDQQEIRFLTLEKLEFKTFHPNAAATAAKSLQSCTTLWPHGRQPTGSPSLFHPNSNLEKENPIIGIELEC